MNVWLGIALVVGGFLAVAIAVLIADVARGDVGGGHHTLERARRILVVATDTETTAEADRWVVGQRREHPRLQCWVLSRPDDQALYMEIEDLIEREQPDAIVMVRHEREHHNLVGTFGRLKEDLRVPVDAIYLKERASA